MKVSGEIETTQLADLFQWIAYQRKTGSLSLTGDEVDHTIYFSQGLIVGTETTVGTSLEGEAQARMILKDALTWNTGCFEYVDGPIPPDVAATNLQITANRLFDEATGRIAATPATAQAVGVGSVRTSQEMTTDSSSAEATDFRSVIIDRVMSGKFKIPLLPTVATKVMQITQRINYSLNDLSKVILTDQVIAANVLKHANSALFGGVREVKTLPMAIQRIGSDTVTKLVFALSLQGIRNENDMFLAAKKQLWEYSSACALFARYIAVPIKLDHNLAFLCGLMQDFGKIVLLSVIQEVVTKELRDHHLSEETVEKILDTYHPMVGSMVGEKWALPSQVIAAMAYHRSLSTKGEPLLYAAVANLSDVIVTRLENLTPEEITLLITEGAERQVMAAELAELPANKHLELNVAQLSAILAHAQECLTFAEEIMTI